MDILLNDIEVRVLGSLMEKSMTTPEYYPLSLNALTNACNQKSNRDPVVSFDETTVVRALDSLREKQLAVLSASSRVPKYSEVFAGHPEAGGQGSGAHYGAVAERGLRLLANCEAEQKGHTNLRIWQRWKQPWMNWESRAMSQSCPGWQAAKNRAMHTCWQVMYRLKRQLPGLSRLP